MLVTGARHQVHAKQHWQGNGDLKVLQMLFIANVPPSSQM